MPSASAQRRSLQHRNWLAAAAVIVFFIVAFTLGI